MHYTPESACGEGQKLMKDEEQTENFIADVSNKVQCQFNFNDGKH